jgi:serine/threonine protein kinase
MEKGKTNLDFFLQKRNKLSQDFQTQEVVYFMHAMLAAHCHLQELNIAHRDVKPENILLFDQDQLLFKICDVGVGTESRGENTKTRTLIGTVAYLSPELFQAYRDLRYKSNYNPFKSDVFSLGLVFLYFGTLHRFEFNVC